MSRLGTDSDGGGARFRTMSDGGAAAGFVAARLVAAEAVGIVTELGWPIVVNASGDIGAPNVAIGLNGGPTGELAGGTSGVDDDGYGVAGATAGIAGGKFPEGNGDGVGGGITAKGVVGAPAGEANEDGSPLEPWLGAPSEREEPPPKASEPPGGGDFAMLGNSTFGAAGHTSAAFGAVLGSMFVRANDTYIPYPTDAKTAMIIRFFSEFMFVLLDESLPSYILHGAADPMSSGERILPAVRCISFYRRMAIASESRIRIMRDHHWFEEADDELHNDEYPENNDFDDDATDTVACPHCGADVYEDADYCPVCDNCITVASGASPLLGRPLWWILLGLAGVTATLAALTGFVSW